MLIQTKNNLLQLAIRNRNTLEVALSTWMYGTSRKSWRKSLLLYWSSFVARLFHKNLFYVAKLYFFVHNYAFEFLLSKAVFFLQNMDLELTSTVFMWEKCTLKETENQCDWTNESYTSTRFILNDISSVDKCVKKCDSLIHQGEYQCHYMYYDAREQKCGLFKECAKTSLSYESIFQVWERICGNAQWGFFSKDIV